MAAGVRSAYVHDKAGARLLKDDVEDPRSVQKIVADSAYRERCISAGMVVPGNGLPGG